jgi:hypothetical protein
MSGALVIRPASPADIGSLLVAARLVGARRKR